MAFTSRFADFPFYVPTSKVDDPDKLFNASLTGGTRRAIDIREGEAIDKAALAALVKRASAFNAKA